MMDKQIKYIVERDTPTHGDDDVVVDWDIRGKPITLGDVRRWSALKQTQETHDE